MCEEADKWRQMKTRRPHSGPGTHDLGDAAEGGRPVLKASPQTSSFISPLSDSSEVLLRRFTRHSENLSVRLAERRRWHSRDGEQEYSSSSGWVKPSRKTQSNQLLSASDMVADLQIWVWWCTCVFAAFGSEWICPVSLGCLHHYLRLSDGILQLRCSSSSHLSVPALTCPEWSDWSQKQF